MAQEALGRPADALASYRLAQERGDLSETTGARIAALTASAAGPLASAPENGATLQR
jgi:hypothetical protein